MSESRGQRDIRDDYKAKRIAELKESIAEFEAERKGYVEEITSLVYQRAERDKRIAELKAVLVDLRTAITTLPLDSFGEGCANTGQHYPIRDEIIAGITKVLKEDVE